MSNLFGATPPRDAGRSLPKGETVGRYTAYLDAQKAVDYLADSKFPVQLVSIVGNELKSVERVTGRLTYPRVALSSAATGAWFGLFVGLALMLFGGSGAGISLIPSMALGAVFWVLFGVLAYALQRGRRDFTSTSQVIATSYDVIVAAEVANEARRLLHQLPMVGQAGHPQAPGGAAHPHTPQFPPSGSGQAPSAPPAGPTPTAGLPRTPHRRIRPVRAPREANGPGRNPAGLASHAAASSRTCRTAARSTGFGGPCSSAHPLRKAAPWKPGLSRAGLHRMKPRPVPKRTRNGTPASTSPGTRMRYGNRPAATSAGRRPATTSSRASSGPPAG